MVVERVTQVYEIDQLLFMENEIPQFDLKTKSNKKKQVQSSKDIAQYTVRAPAGEWNSF